MTKTILMTLSIFLLAGMASAHGRYEPINMTDFVANPNAYQGRMVEVTARVIAIGADSKSLQLFDEQNRVMIGVRLMQLSKAQRSALMRNPVCNVLVYGQATVSGGRLVIEADKVVALTPEPTETGESSRGKTEAGGR